MESLQVLVVVAKILRLLSQTPMFWQATLSFALENKSWTGKSSF